MSTLRNPRSALVVDDSKSARFALRRSLEALSVSVDTAESAQEAYRFLAGQKPDMVFLDHQMPNEDGFDALRAIKASPEWRHIPVIICSSSDEPQFLASAQALGALTAIDKPPHPEQLRKVFQQLDEQLAVTQRISLPPLVGDPELEIPLQPAVGAEFGFVAAPSRAVPAANAAAAPVRPLRSVTPLDPPAAAPAAAAASNDFNVSQEMTRLRHELRDEIQDLRRLLDQSISALPAPQALPQRDAEALARIDALEQRLGRLERQVIDQLTLFQRQLSAQLEHQANAQREAAVNAAVGAAERRMEQALDRWAERVSSTMLHAFKSR